MELFTTATLWKNYDRRAQPLEQTVISSEKQADRTVEYVFFNGDPCADGCTRIFSRYYRPEKANGAGVVVMNDVMDVFDETSIYCRLPAIACLLSIMSENGAPNCTPCIRILSPKPIILSAQTQGLTFPTIPNNHVGTYGQRLCCEGLRFWKTDRKLPGR